MFDKSNYGGAYGCSLDSVFSANGKKFKPINFVLEKKVDDKNVIILHIILVNYRNGADAIVIP